MASLKPIFFIQNPLTKDCNYKISSGYFDNNIPKRLAFDGKMVFVNLVSEEEDFVLFTSFEDTIGQKRKIQIKHRDWLAGNGESLVISTYFVVLEKKISKNDEYFLVLKIREIISAFPEFGIMDGVLFFSNKQGFIGSYYVHPDKPLIITERTGNILDPILDYSGYHFSKIQ